MATRVTHDPQHPDFPHGTAKGYRRGCRTEEACPSTITCRMAQSKAAKRQRLNRAKYGPYVKSASPQLMKRVREHIAYLYEHVPGDVGSAIGRSAGIATTIAADTLRCPDRNLAPATAHAILGVTVAQLREQYEFAPREQVALRIRQMQALGYPIEWQSTQTGHRLRHTIFPGKQQSGRPALGVPKQIATAVEELARRVGDTPADAARDGIDQRGISNAKHVARRNGVYPPACYNEDGTLDWRAIPEHPWSVSDERAHDRIALLRAFLDHEATCSHMEIAKIAGRQVREVERLVERYKLRGHESRRPKRIAWLRAQIDRFDANADLDPVKFCLDIELSSLTKFRLDHPGAVAWLAEHPDWQNPTVVARLRNKAQRAQEQAEQVAA